MEFLYNHKARITLLGHPTSVILHHVSCLKRVVCRRIVRLSVLLQAESWLNVNTFCVTKVPFMAFFCHKICFFKINIFILRHKSAIYGIFIT